MLRRSLPVAGLFHTKAGVLAALLRIGGFSLGHAVEVGFLLAQAGDLLLSQPAYAMAAKLLHPAAGQFILLARA